MRFFTVVLLCLAPDALWCATPGRSGTPSADVIRLDDLLASAAVKASNANSSAVAAEPVEWRNWFSTADITWQLVRGRIGYRNGDLMVSGEGSTPVILSPKQQIIDWKLYQAVEIRMSAHGGNEIKIKIAGFEASQKLGTPDQYNLYRFELPVDAPPENRPMGIMPTDSLHDIVAINSIRLIPRRADFPKPIDRAATLGKLDEYRNVIYVHSPSSIAFSLSIPKSAHLHFGTGITSKDSPVRFRVSIDGVSADLYSKTLGENEAWSDADVDLSAFGGRTVKLVFRTEANREGVVALWANPLLTAAAPKSLPNILIYTIDTLRADHASLYGYRRDTTPFLKKLGASGIVFTDCQAQSTWTKTSIASLLTSLYSFTHGIIHDSETIPPGAATLAEQLRAAGYVTASIVASPFAGRSSGLERGFDYLLEYPIILRHRTERADRGTDSAALNKVVFPWLERHHDEPFFLYAHSTDPHAPYRPPPPFEAAFANPADTAEFDRDYNAFKTNREYGGGAIVTREKCTGAGVNGDRFIHEAIDRYDGEVLHNDHSFELLVDKLKQLGVLSNTLIIVLSDHGEEFWDHGWTAHGHSVYQELTHCLLMMWNPGLFPSPRRIETPVQLIDVMPTVLDLVKLKIPAKAEGQSLAPLARGQSFDRRGLVIASRFAGDHPAGVIPENSTDSFAIIDSKWKFIYRNKAQKVKINKVELYDRVSDLAERHDVAGEHPEIVEARMKDLARWIDAQNKVRAMLGHTGNTEFDREAIKELRSLGYLGGSSR